MTAPLEGLRVLDLGTRIAAPFCAGLLGEMGAEVIKVEQPGTGDFMREIGPFLPTDGEEPGYSLFWAVEGRGRKSVTLNLRERTELVNGLLNIDSAPGKGTRIQVYIPLSEEAADRLHRGKM